MDCYGIMGKDGDRRRLREEPKDLITPLESKSKEG